MDQRGNMKMEDYKRLLHVFLPLLLAGPPGRPPLFHPTLMKALGRLRRVAENHTTPHDDESEDERLARIEEFEVELQEYAKEASGRSGNALLGAQLMGGRTTAMIRVISNSVASEISSK